MAELVLRPWKLEDAEEVAAVANNPKIADNLRNVFPHPYSLQDAEEFAKDCIQKDGLGQITRIIEVNGRAVGSISVCVQGDVYEKCGELGYWLAEEYWGRGIMTEAVKRICKEAFETFDIVRIYAEPFEYNRGSRSVLQKAGFTCEGIMRNGVFKNGKIHSYCMYSLLRDEI